jgi:hypothetical protein
LSERVDGVEMEMKMQIVGMGRRSCRARDGLGGRLGETVVFAMMGVGKEKVSTAC